MGNDKDIGIIPRINEYLFNQVDERLAALALQTDEGVTKYMITVRKVKISGSFMQIIAFKKGVSNNNV